MSSFIVVAIWNIFVQGNWSKWNNFRKRSEYKLWVCQKRMYTWDWAAWSAEVGKGLIVAESTSPVGKGTAGLLLMNGMLANAGDIAGIGEIPTSV